MSTAHLAWSNDEQSLLAELETVQRTATTIIEHMEQPFVSERPNQIAAYFLPREEVNFLFRS